MSDDEDYYEDYEIIWIEDPEPGIADDLAETAHHDPVFLDDPAFEVEEYYSDWDEMTDDYFDDEPTVLKRERMARKMEEVERNRRDNDQDQDARTEKGKGGNKVDLSSFQSVIWKPAPHTNAPVDPPNLYPPGEGEKVALLKNWREVFKEANPGIERSRRRKGSPSVAAKGRSIAVEERREDSSDRTSTSGLFSRENGVGSPGDGSNTTPAKSVSEDGHDLDEEMADDPPAPPAGKTTSKTRPRSTVVVEVPLPRKENIPPPQSMDISDISSPRETTGPKEISLPKKRGRKRKTETTSPPHPPPRAEDNGNQNGTESGSTRKRPRSDRVASRNGDLRLGAGTQPGSTGPGSLRRSTRQTK